MENNNIENNSNNTIGNNFTENSNINNIENNVIENNIAEKNSVEKNDIGNNIIQNIDIPTSNPLENTTPSEVQNQKTKLNKDPKVIILIVMAVIIVLLIIASSMISRVRNRVVPVQPEPTPISKLEITPTSIVDRSIPPQYLERFKDIDKEIKTTEDFLPPQVDTNIGMQ